MPNSEPSPRGQAGHHQVSPEALSNQIIESVLAMNRANLAAAPIFCDLCDSLMNNLLNKGFSRRESMQIIIAAVKK
jgi:hypothetical protein